MSRILVLVYGVVCYVIFFGMILHAVWFVWTLDAPQTDPSAGRALLIDAGLLGLFALQHSGMAREGFKRVWTKLIPTPIERSTYVLAASLAVLILIAFWQPLPTVVWELESPLAHGLLNIFFVLGWLMVFYSTALLGHFDLFGVKQVWAHYKNVPYKRPAFAKVGLYKFVRHPIYLGFLIAFWSAPRMTMGHFLLSAVATSWLLLAILLEERDLMNALGEPYKHYQSTVSMLIPWPRRRKLS